MSVKAGVLLPLLGTMAIALLFMYAVAEDYPKVGAGFVPPGSGVRSPTNGEATDAAITSSETIRFRRVLVPEGRVKDWPLGDGKYLPLDMGEFDRLVAAIHLRGPGTQNMPGAAIASTRYEAKLLGDHFVGRASADIVLADRTPAIVPLEPCNLAIGNLAWGNAERPPSPTEENAGARARVLLGLGGDGKLQLRVDQSDRLQFDWSLAGHRDSADVLGFLFEIPNAPANELLLDLPDGVTPAIDRGIVVGSEAAGKRTRRWQIELGGHHRCRMRILPTGLTGRRPQLALLRESRTYDFSLRGVEVAAQWRLQVHNEPLTQVTVRLDPGLELASARYGDVALSWSVAPLAAGEGTRAVLTLPEPIRDAERVIRLSALAQPHFDRPWRLPRIRAEGLFWQEGNITLLTPEPLVNTRIAPLGCGQTGTGSLSAPRMGESLQFQAYQPDATVEVSLSRRRPALQSLSAASVEIGVDEVAVRLATDFRLSEGATFALEADVSPQWIVESVESTPVDALADWSLEPCPDQGQRLSIRLNAALSPEKPVRLVVAARQSCSALVRKIGIDDLSPVRFRDVGDGKQVIAVRPAASYALKLAGDEGLKRIRFDALGRTEQELFSSPPQDLLFERDSRANPLEITLVGQKAKYAGTIQIDAAIAQGVVRETCLLRCTPKSGRIERVLVQFYPVRDTAPRWNIGADEDRQVSARKWSKDEQTRAGWSDSVETWELTVRQPRGAPFEITAMRELTLGYDAKSQPAVASNVLTLAALPEAATQRGLVVVRSSEPKAIRIENRRLKPMFPEPLDPDCVQTVRGVFGYDPARDVGEGVAAAVRVHCQSEGRVLDAWVWQCHLQSWHQGDGTTQHQATYEVQNAGRRRVQLTLPPDVVREDIHGIWIDGKPVAWQWNIVDEASYVTIDIPSDSKFPRVVMEWTTQGPPLGIVGCLSPALPMPDMVVMARQWTAFLPPGYSCLGSAAPSPAGGSETTWSRRLFGPFGRAEGARRLDPLSIGDWLMPLTELRNHEPTIEAHKALRRADSSDGPADDFAQGWNVSRIEIPDGESVSLTFVHGTSMRVFGTVVFLMVAAVGCWKALDRPAILVSVFGGFGAAAMALPDIYVPIATGGAIGIAFCAVWRWLHPWIPVALATSSGQEVRTPETPNLVPGSTVTRATNLSAILLISMLAPFAGSVARAETPRQDVDPSAGMPAMATPHRVLIPIDANKKPIGGKVFVPELFYRDLYRHAVLPTEKPQGWLVLRATYRGALTAESGDGSLGVDTLRAFYDLQVFGRGTRVRIPLRAESANLIPNGVTLDGRAIDPEWEPGASALAFDVAEPGQYRLEVALRPIVRHAERGDRSNPYDATEGPSRQTVPVPSVMPGFDIAIPRVAQSRLELTLPDAASALEVPSACGAVRIERDPARLIADLGPTDRLTVRWREGAASGAAGPAVDAEQLIWLKVQPGSVVIVARFKLRAVEDQIQQMQLAVDPRLRLLPLPGDDPPAVQVGQESGQSRLIAFRWSRPVADQATLETTFLLGGATGVGNCRLPQIELLGARTTKRWMAVSVDPALDREEQKPQRLEAVPVAEFLKAWDAAALSTSSGPNSQDASLGTEAKPHAAYRLPAAEIDWIVSTRPHEPRSTADQTLNLSCNEDHVNVRFEAQVSTTSGYLFQHQLTAPQALKIEYVSLFEGDVERASRWSQDNDGRVTVFLNGAASGQQKLVVRGRLPIEIGKEWALPQMHLDRCQTISATTRLFRRPSVLLTIRGGRQQTADNASASGNSRKADLGRFVAAFSGNGSQPLPVAVIVERNRPASTAPPSMPRDSRAADLLTRRTETPAATPQQSGFVRLADVTVTWLADRTCFGAVLFDLAPGGSAHCPLHVPKEYELIHVSVEGIPVALERVGDADWRFPLASERLPQRVEVLFRGNLIDANQANRYGFRAPMLGQWPVRQTLWTIVGPPSWTINDVEELATVSDWKQNLVRLKSVIAAIESAAAVSSDHWDETARWLLPWGRRLAEASTDLQHELATAEDTMEVAEAKREANALEKRGEALATRLGDKKKDTVGITERMAMSPLRFLQGSPDTARPIARYCVPERADSLTIDCQEVKQAGGGDRLAAAVAILLLACLTVVGLVRGTLAGVLQRWPHLFGTVFGLAWWLWLTPSVLGLGIALGCVVAAGRERMRATKRTASAGQ